jgi:hypothetical protein
MYIPSVLNHLVENTTTRSFPSGHAVASLTDRLYLTPSYDYTLILASWLVSALGGYTATQLMTQVATTKSLRARISWVTLASLAFGGW